MKKIKYKIVSGRDEEKRVPSRILEEMIQKEIKQGHRAIEVDAFGQHGIGGRLWHEDNETISIRIRGQAGQRAGSLGCPNTEIEILGPVSDDVGWLNAGARITVLWKRLQRGHERCGPGQCLHRRQYRCQGHDHDQA